MKLFCIHNQKKIIQKKVNLKIKKVLKSGQFILGPNVKKLENQLCKFTKSKYCTSTSSGTDALLISLMALGIKKGDEVITTAFTYIATIEVILRLGATPVFADIKKETGLIDENDIRLKITKKTKAIIIVSLYGNIPDIKKIKSISNKIKIIEDGAQSFGSKYKNKYSCNLTDIGCTSFYPTKNLSCYGDGGAIFTNSKYLDKKFKLIRNHGEEKRYNSVILGICGRLDEIQASILIEKLKIFRKENIKRVKNSIELSKILKKKCLKKNINSSIAYNTFPILVKNRNLLIKELNKHKIGYNIYYPKPIYKQKFFKKKIKLINTEFVCNRIINLPSHPYLKKIYFKKIKKIFSNENFNSSA